MTRKENPGWTAVEPMLAHGGRCNSNEVQPARGKVLTNTGEFQRIATRKKTRQFIAKASKKTFSSVLDVYRKN